MTTCRPPAQPTVKIPSSSESRFRRIRPLSMDGSSFVGPGEARLFVHRKEELEGRMGKVALGEGHCHGDGNAVIGAKGCPVRAQPLPVTNHGNGIRP